jgi:hypothetical protein
MIPRGQKQETELMNVIRFKRSSFRRLQHIQKCIKYSKQNNSLAIQQITLLRFEYGAIRLTEYKHILTTSVNFSIHGDKYEDTW